jgi:hypothetical protein
MIPHLISAFAQTASSALEEDSDRGRNSTIERKKSQLPTMHADSPCVKDVLSASLSGVRSHFPHRKSSNSKPNKGRTRALQPTAPGCL